MRPACAALALLLAFLFVLAVRWTLAELQMLGFQQWLEDLPELETNQVLQGADPFYERALAWRGPHPSYLNRRARLERRLGLRSRRSNVVAAFEHFEAAESLALQAYEAQPLPYPLLRAAATRADRFLVDGTFGDYLRQAANLAPWDAGAMAGMYAVLLPHWDAAGSNLRTFAVEELDRIQESPAAYRRVVRVIRSLQMWPALCRADGVAELEPKRCAQSS